MEIEKKASTVLLVCIAVFAVVGISGTWFIYDCHLKVSQNLHTIFIKN